MMVMTIMIEIADVKSRVSGLITTTMIERKKIVV